MNWILRRLLDPSIAAVRDDERERIADWLRAQARFRFDLNGPEDARGTAFWDAADGLVEGNYVDSKFSAEFALALEGA